MKFLVLRIGVSESLLVSSKWAVANAPLGAIREGGCVGQARAFENPIYRVAGGSIPED
jgi:hypothetical protein